MRVRQRNRYVVIPLLVLFAWLTAAYFAFYFAPSSSPSYAADAVVRLAGSDGERTPVATRLIEGGYAPTLLLSTDGPTGDRQPKGACGSAVQNSRTLCFTPNPSSTRGEAIGIARVAESRNWDSIILVTSRYHAARAQLLVSQCSSVDIQVVVSEPPFSIFEWARAFVEESAGVVDAVMRPECR